MARSNTAAANFDASENAVAAHAHGQRRQLRPAVRGRLLAIKFTLMSIAILYVLSGLALWLRARRLQPRLAP